MEKLECCNSLMKKAIANTSKSEIELVSCLNDDNYEVRKRVITNSFISLKSIKERAVIEQNKAVLSEIARVDKLDKELSFILLNNKDFNSNCRSELAQNLNLSKEVFKILIEDEDEYVVFKTLTNKKISRDLISKKLHDKSEFIREVANELLK